MAQQIASAICVHDDYWFLQESILSVLPAGPCYVFVSRLPWAQEPGDWERCAKIAEEAGANVVLGDWSSEQEHRLASLQYLKEQGSEFVITVDGDEVVEPELLSSLARIADADLADAVHVNMDTYWKSAEYVIRPRESLTPVALVKLDSVRFLYIREFEALRRMTLGAGCGVMHHLSYAGPDERILRKIGSWSHKDEVIDDWFERMWKGWDRNKLMRNLHPTHPQAYGFAERIRVPEILSGVEVPVRSAVPAKPLPKTVSAVIPLCGNEQDIKECLDSLSLCLDLVSEVVVVDNASPDGAAEIADSYPFVRLIRNKENLGFAKASNQGLEASSGEAVVFLNSDTIVPRIGLQRLLESLWFSSSVAASGPFTNHSGHLQRIEPTYTSLDTIDLFAEDFASACRQDIEVDMLVGFCLAVRRTVLDEIGGFDESFGIGTFEDNDLCYRMRRAGHRLLISANSFVHHHGSRTLKKVERVQALLAENQKKYAAKWRDDLETGFASTLSGLSADRISFSPERKPELLEAEMRRLAQEAQVSLCMIVKDEERVVGECLRSASPFFWQTVVVDTGSTDKTIEIVRQSGAELYEHPWEDSFSAARNKSLGYAKGKWVFWMDADDTLPKRTGEAVLRAALAAPDDIVGFVIPVQFVEDGEGAGTRVDHVKLFRNLPGIEFSGRIHEQILPSLRKHGEIARIDAVVLHSGYDTSEAGQAKKRKRDEKLLLLDLEERPNHPFVLFNLGMTAHYTDGHEDAVKWLSKSIEAAQPQESHLRKAYALKAMSLKKLGRTDEARATLAQGLEAVGDDPEIRFQTALLLTELGRLEEAKEQYLTINEDVSGHFSSIDIGILGFKRHHNLASVCFGLGQYEEAKKWWLKALETAPDFLPSAFELFDAALGCRDHEAAKLCLDRIQATEGFGPNWLKMAEKYGSSAGGPEYAEFLIRQSLERNPNSPESGIALARFLLGQERVSEAAPLLRELERVGSAEAAYYLGVADIREGRYRSALAHMERALELNPGHDETIQQVQNLWKTLF